MNLYRFSFCLTFRYEFLKSTIRMKDLGSFLIRFFYSDFLILLLKFHKIWGNNKKKSLSFFTVLFHCTILYPHVQEENTVFSYVLFENEHVRKNETISQNRTNRFESKHKLLNYYFSNLTQKSWLEFRWRAAILFGARKPALLANNVGLTA